MRYEFTAMFDRDEDSLNRMPDSLAAALADAKENDGVVFCQITNEGGGLLCNVIRFAGASLSREHAERIKDILRDAGVVK